MKTVYLLSLLFCCSLLTFCQPQGRPIPPGLRQAERQPGPADVVPPLGPQQRKPDFARLHKDADELAELAGTIPAAVQQVSQGQFPKDLNEKLKHIEKLARKIRTQLSPP